MTMLKQNNCWEHSMHLKKINFVYVITGFLNVLNQPDELLMQNFVFLSVKRERCISREFGSEIYILCLTMETFLWN